jgi:DNA-binding MarR family transcriptional regulator
MGAKIVNMNERQTPTDREILEKTKEMGFYTSTKVVLFCLRSRMNAKNRFVCWPSQKEIAEDAGITERQVRRSLNELREAGLIKIEGARFGKGPHRYSFVRWWENEEVKTEGSQGKIR